MPPTPLDNAFGQSLSAWVARVTQQLRDIDNRLEQQRTATIEINQELEDLGKSTERVAKVIEDDTRNFKADFREKLSLMALQLATIESSVKELQGNRNYIVGAVMLSVVGAVLSFVLVQKK